MKTMMIARALLASVAMDAHAYERGREFGRKEAGETEPDMKALAAGLKQATDEVKKFAEDADKKLKSGEAMTTEAKKAADEALVKLNEIAARMTEAEQKLARRGGEDRQEEKSIGQSVVEDESVKAFLADRARGKSRVSVSLKAITTLGTGADTAAGALVTPQRVPGIVTPPERRMTVRDLLTPGRTNSNSIQFVQETGFTNAAAAVSEGALKPQSTIEYAEETAKVATIAHWVQTSLQILDDAPQLQSAIDGRLRYGLMFVEEQEILKGDGTGVHLLGIIPQATAFSSPIPLSTGVTMIDQIRYAMLQAVLAEYPATGHVLHPTDWARIETMKDEVGRYIIGNPQDGTTPTLWRLPVVETPAMTVDKFLTGAFKLGAQIFDRQEANVLLSTEDRDNFIRNMVTIRGEERLALCVYRPECFIYGDFGNV
ncbi:phage major capsid protein [Mesorhizobium sp. B2-2-4]|uniref:phage major capsid protein n=1 Tax=unclassified Mesorhizobium TaxID=325217 RepID=UPI00112BCA8D|nr:MULTISPECIES: phage major capsid protein [unclassified Mesorhizobium]TPM59145.1 phage major capsid protein [Mesorhizobium sp. B2-2-4]TPM67630.1 phage major capsid protein [Mesorhizobium sp. B2-2-1]TPN66912.1 phage major capsid protein [Mesorhizobium sp. B1-1-3]